MVAFHTVFSISVCYTNKYNSRESWEMKISNHLTYCSRFSCEKSKADLSSFSSWGHMISSTLSTVAGVPETLVLKRGCVFLAPFCTPLVWLSIVLRTTARARDL